MHVAATVKLVKRLNDQIGEVRVADVVLGVRSVSGFFGMDGTAFFEGDVDSVGFGFAGGGAGLEVDCEPSCSHCLRRSAILPGLLLPFVPATFGTDRAATGDEA